MLDLIGGFEAVAFDRLQALKRAVSGAPVIRPTCHAGDRRPSCHHPFDHGAPVSGPIRTYTEHTNWLGESRIVPVEPSPPI